MFMGVKIVTLKENLISWSKKHDSWPTGIFLFLCGKALESGGKKAWYRTIYSHYETKSR